MRRFEHFVGWWRRPAGRLVGLALLGLTFAAPAWLMADELRWFALFGDDFAYIAEAKNAVTMAANLLSPHNTHIVPLFRLWTYALISVAGNLARMQAVFGVASYFGLIAAMAVVGLFVKRETSRSSLALAAMAGLGISTVVMPTVIWYSAGQALWAGTAIVATLLCVRNWSIRGGTYRFVLMLIAVWAAPLIWTGGHVAGPAGAAYLLATDRPRSRRGALVLILVTALAVVLELVLVRHELQATKMIWEHHRELWPRPIQAVLHTLQAIAEAIFLGNLGLEAITSPFQAGAMLVGVVVLWGWSRGGRRPSPLEAAGASIVLLSYLMVYVFRGNLPFDSLRSVRWYHAIPQVGAVLFVSGWWASLRSIPDQVGPQRLTRLGGLAVLALILLLCGMQTPHAERSLLAAVRPMTDLERPQFPIAELQRLRALYLLQDHHDRQYRQLIRLDLAEQSCVRLGIGPETIRRTLGRVTMPGLPELQTQSDVVGLMTLPRDRNEINPTAVRSAMENLIGPEPERPPPWLSPNTPWPGRR